MSTVIFSLHFITAMVSFIDYHTQLLKKLPKFLLRSCKMGSQLGSRITGEQKYSELEKSRVRANPPEFSSFPNQLRSPLIRGRGGGAGTFLMEHMPKSTQGVGVF